MRPPFLLLNIASVLMCSVCTNALGEINATTQTVGHKFQDPIALKQPTSEAIPVSTLPLSLRGVYIPASGQGVAVIEQAGKQRLVKVGEVLFQPKLFKIVQVTPRALVIQQQNHLESIPLETPAYPRANTVPPVIYVDSPELATVDLKAIRDQTAADPYSLLTLIKTEAVQEKGQFAGYRLQPGFNPAVFIKSGLKPGDIVHAINGVRLKDETQTIELLKHYAGAIQLSLTIQRGAEEVNVLVNFQEQTQPELTS